jgi:hypothetical protein
MWLYHNWKNDRMLKKYHYRNLKDIERIGDFIEIIDDDDEKHKI